MRVLVADQETDMLEQIARAFEVDVATSKATCVDLLRANEFDVIVACERLSDGSGLELLSHVGQRWPGVVRILAIDPERRALLKGKLGPFKLFETIPYPITEEKLEAALTRAAEAISRDYDDEPPARSAPVAQPVPAPVTRSAPAQNARVTNARVANARAATPPPNARPAAPLVAQPRTGTPVPAARAAVAPVPAPRTNTPAVRPAQRPGSGGQSPASGSRPRSLGSDPGYPPLPRRGSKIVPLGSPETQFRILPHDYHEQHMPGRLPRREEPSQKAPTLQEKAAALASGAMRGVSELVRQIKPLAPSPAPKAPPGKKR
jgi:hypothetical protein